MEISVLKALIKNISSFFHLSSRDNLSYEPARKYYQRIEEILKLLKSVIDAIFDTNINPEEPIQEACVKLGQYIDELRELLENWHPLMSKVYFALQVEALFSKTQTIIVDIFNMLKSSGCLPLELSASSLEISVQKVKHISWEQASSVINRAIAEQEDGLGPTSEILAKFSDSLSLKSNQEILIEAVALEKLKENAEQVEKTNEAEFIDQLITLITHMHESLITMKQDQSLNPVPIPADFCCPLSLELMTDPVIVASGQTYERAYIRKWNDLGLTICPKTRQTLAHSNLIPNYTVKALIANWCEMHNVKLPDPMKALNSSPSMFGLNINHHLSPERTRSTGSPQNGIVSHSEGASPSHPPSSLEGSFSGNSHTLDVGRLSLKDNEDGLESSGQRGLESRGQLSGASGEDESSSDGHNRSASISSVHSNASSLQGPTVDGNDVSSAQMMASYSTDASGDLSMGPQPSSLMGALRGSDFPPRLETRPRNQAIWRRPSDRFLPRIISSPTTETRADLSRVEAQVRSLVEELKSTSIPTQQEATYQIRLLAKHNMDNRIIIANCGAIDLLVSLLRSTDLNIQEHAVTALLNLSINDNNKTAIANAEAIEPLIHVLETGNPEAKENSAATLFSLSVVEENKVRIGRSRAIKPLVDLLGSGTPRGKRDAATALFNLSIFHENKGRIVQAGAVKHLMDLMDPAAGMVDKAVAVLANLSTIPEGRTAIGQEGGIPFLVEVVELGSARAKENAAAALLQLCTNSSRFCNMVLQEGAVPPLVALSQSGTPRAKEKAQALLSYFRSQRQGGGVGRG
ncbi:U-box domain-containing protein 4-like [Impatiens glandulifera]|uniref:U-box domain-containing protein 4-like n=1 Tax=Impatiens glandulifera TaxID=253017 RepID=UPI001FB13E2F|nr:U-box domain-containing protein 4-like [Impatiens glandulifera]XP_047337236.1 U-box domain-containing protein 4-like [Impatiens glandulifera]